jgi:hypothetical protein
VQEAEMTITSVGQSRVRQRTEESEAKGREQAQSADTSQANNNGREKQPVKRSQKDPDIKSQTTQSNTATNRSSSQQDKAQNAERLLEKPGKRVDVLG